MAVKKVSDLLADYSPRVPKKVHRVEWFITVAAVVILIVAGFLK